MVNELAGCRFVPLVTRSFGSPLFQAGFLAGGAFINPFIFLALPFFSPRFVGTSATRLGAATQFAQRVGRTPIGRATGAVIERGVRTGVGQIPSQLP